MNSRVIPEFQTETEEAKWWFDHDEELTDDFEQAVRQGTLTQGSALRRADIRSAVVQLDLKDDALAQAQALERGVEYQVYLQMLLHEALERAAAQG